MNLQSCTLEWMEQTHKKETIVCIHSSLYFPLCFGGIPPVPSFCKGWSEKPVCVSGSRSQQRLGPGAQSFLAFLAMLPRCLWPSCVVSCTVCFNFTSSCSQFNGWYWGIGLGRFVTLVSHGNFIKSSPSSLLWRLERSSSFQGMQLSPGELQQLSVTCI